MFSNFFYNKDSKSFVASSDPLIYSELSLTVEKLAVLRAWAEVYIVAGKNGAAERGEASRRSRLARSEAHGGGGGSTESLLSLVQPELALLSHHWSVALKDYAYLSLPYGELGWN